jgi:hypothetical protein
MSVADLTQQKVIAPPPWHIQLWLVEADCKLYDLAPTTSGLPTSVHVPLDEPTHAIATLRHFYTDATAMLTDLSGARPLIQTELNVKILDSGQLISGLVD